MGKGGVKETSDKTGTDMTIDMKQKTNTNTHKKSHTKTYWQKKHKNYLSIIQRNI